MADLHVYTGERVLDVAGGSGNTALAAARRWAEVTCTDAVPELLEIAAQRASAERVPLRVQVAEVEDLPFPDGGFDVVTSTFGAMYAADHHRAAEEMLRVLRPGGRLGLTAWTPDGWCGAQGALSRRYLPPPPDQEQDPPQVPGTAWGEPEHVRALLGDRVEALQLVTRTSAITATDTTALFELWIECAAPLAAFFAALQPQQRAAARREWIALAERFNSARDGTCEIAAEHLSVTATRR
ncbi:methyltransferase domain-containing protein [Kineococcus sp. T90]|nr:methyltransferase domain-containing protein [Kineococcus indalonis]